MARSDDEGSGRAKKTSRAKPKNQKALVQHNVTPESIEQVVQLFLIKWFPANNRLNFSLNVTLNTGVGGAAFSPDMRRLATINRNHLTLRMYVLRIEDLISLAKSRLTRSLTIEECKKYLHREACPIKP